MGLDIRLYLLDTHTSEHVEYSRYRNFNALYGYFHRKCGIDNLVKIYLNRDTIDELYLILNEIKYNSNKSDVLLPSFDGPLFGSLEYDKIYINHVRQAASDFYHAKFVDYSRYRLYIIAHWHY